MSLWTTSNRIFQTLPTLGSDPAFPTNNPQVNPQNNPQDWTDQILRHAEAHASLSPSLRRELTALREETDPQIFASDLFTLGQRQESARNYALAGLLYQGVQNFTPHSPYAQRAGHRLEVLSGGGSIGERCEHLGREFIPTVFEPSLLIGMWAGARAFRGVSQGVLRLFAEPGVLGRGLAWGAGFSAEVPAFVFSARGVNAYLGRPVDWSAGAIGRDLRQAGLLLGALKSFGLLGQMGRLGTAEASALSPNWIRWHNQILPQASMFGGILTAHAAETYLGWRKRQDLGVVLLESLATLIQFNAVGNLAAPWQSALGLGSEAPLSNSPRSLPRFRLGWQAVSPEGVPLGPPRFYSIGEAPSTLPPPIPVRSESRLARGSGIQAIAERPSYEVFRENIGQLGGRLLRLFNSEGFLHRWVIEVPEINRGLKSEIENISVEATMGTWDPQLMANLEAINRELGEIDLLFERLGRTQSPAARVRFEPSDDSVREFFSYYYRFPNRLINFMDSSANMESIVDTIQNARKSLDNMTNSLIFPKGPVFSQKITEDFIQESHRIGGEVQRVYIGAVNGHGPRHTYDTLLDFHSLLRQVHRRLLREGKPIPFMEETESTFVETGQIISLMKGRGYANGEALPPGAIPEGFLQEIYQAPTSFADFLRESDLRLLRSARISSRQARLRFEEEPD